MSDNGLVSKIYKELIKLNTWKTNTPVKNWQKTWIDTSPKKTSRWPTDTWKNVSTSLIIREIQIKTTMRYHLLTSVRMANINNSGNNRCWWGCRERGSPLHFWWECKLVHPLWKTVWRFLKKLKIEELLYNPEIAPLGIYPKDTKVLIQRGTRTPMFIAALSTIAKIWKEPKCPSTDEWIKEMWYICTMEYYLAIEKNKILPFAMMWMALEYIKLSEMSRSEKDKHHMISLICGA